MLFRSDKLDKPFQIRVQFIHQALQSIHEQLIQQGSGIRILFDTPLNAFKQLTEEFNIRNVFTNHDYESYAIERDRLVADWLTSKDIVFQHFKDQVVFEKLEVTKDDGSPYTVFTPYSRKWKAKLALQPLQFYPSEKKLSRFYKFKSKSFPSLKSIGFESKAIEFPEYNFPREIIKKYTQQRDYPAINGTSKLGVHLRFGTISIRELVQFSTGINETYLNELIWREFYQSILYNFPHISKGFSFKREYDKIKWRNNEGEFEKWCNGQTGYPIVDAGMRELNATGFMHNRVRMIVAS